jgi:transposase
MEATAADPGGQGILHPRYPRSSAHSWDRRHDPRGGRPSGLDPAIYADRNVVERCFNRLKQYRAIATRYDKTATSYRGMLDLATLHCILNCAYLSITIPRTAWKSPVREPIH